MHAAHRYGGRADLVTRVGPSEPPWPGRAAVGWVVLFGCVVLVSGCFVSKAEVASWVGGRSTPPADGTGPTGDASEEDATDDAAGAGAADASGDGGTLDDGASDDAGVDSASDSATEPGEVSPPELVVIAGHSFTMGCTPGQSSCEADEIPATPVTLTQDFEIGRTEVTQAEFASMMGYNPAYHVACGANCPVESVSWHEAAAYANGVSLAMGLPSCYACTGVGPDVACAVDVDPYRCDGYRLPTEAEWEAAARCGGDERYAGGGDIDRVAWYSDNSDGSAHAVAEKARNACGVFDMSGNVLEWTQDLYGVFPAGELVDPRGAETGAAVVARGGNWSNAADFARVSRRGGSDPGLRIEVVGFRLARTAR
jgi:formylglycine-generating enzyme required for sulfatase activity